MFEYKSDILTGFEEISSNKKVGYSIKDIYFESPFNRRVTAYLIVPDTPGKHSAVIFLHHGQGNRNTYLAEAELLAKKGVISLLLDVPFLKGDLTQNMPRVQKLTKFIESLVDIKQYIQIIIDIRRSVDFLCSQDNVDEKRIAYVGHSFGAALGGVLAGIENRIMAYVLIAGYGKASEWVITSEYPTAAFIRSFLPPERFDLFILNLQRLNAIHYIKNAAPSTIYFQFADEDEFLGHGQAVDYYQAASFPKKLSSYKTDHLFTNCNEALQDRIEWLSQQFQTPSDNLLKETTKY